MKKNIEQKNRHTLIITNEEGDWLCYDEHNGFFTDTIKKIVADNNWHPHDNKKPFISKLDITKEDLKILLQDMKEKMTRNTPKDMTKYAHYKKIKAFMEIDEELDGADYRLAEGVFDKITKLLKKIEQ